MYNIKLGMLNENVLFPLYLIMQKRFATDRLLNTGKSAPLRNDYPVRKLRQGTFVEYDERDEFGILTSFMSDYDLLVVTSNEDVRDVGHLLDTVDDKYYKRPDNQVPIQFINDDIEKLNSDLSEGRYFYTSIQKQGIMLYDSGNYKLERPRKLNFREITQQSQEYFDEKFEKAGYFLDHASFDYEKGRYNLASFDLPSSL